MSGPLPHDTDAERTVLGSILVNADQLEAVEQVLSPRSFYSGGNRVIYRAMLALRDGGKPIDVQLLAAKLRDAGTLEDVGGEVVLARLFEGLPRSSNAKFHAERVESLHRRRNVMQHAQAVIDAAGNGTSDRDLAELLEGLGDERKEAATLRALDLGKLLTEEIEPVPWAVPGWLATGDRVILAGDGGIGKSWLCLDLALALANGGETLGAKIATGASRVLVIDEENNPRLVRYRLRKAARGRNLTPEDIAELPLRYYSQQGLNLDDDDRLQALFRVVEEFKPDWIILDALVRLHRRDENDNSAMADFFATALQPLSTHYGAGQIISHHLAKPPSGSSRAIEYRLRGASEIRNWADQVWGLEREDGKLLLKHVKCRWDAESEALALNIADIDDGDATVINAENAAAMSERTVIEILRDRTFLGVPRQEVIAALARAGLSGATKAATRTLGRLYSEGRVKRQKDGKETRYWLAEHAPDDAD